MNKFWPRLKNKHTLILITILLLSAILRFYKINTIPHGMYWDEAAIIYNAWGISEWHRDEHGIKMPLSFKSFGDYKAPLLIYFLATLYKVVDLNPDLLRLSIAAFGVGNVLLTYLIAARLFQHSRNRSTISLSAAALMGITPWAVNFSRVGFEAVLAVTLIMLGVFAGLKARTNKWWWYAASGCFSLSFYAYHSTKIFIPLFLFGSVLIGLNVIKKSFKHLIGPIILFILISIPFINDTLKGEGFERGKSLIIYQDGQIAPLTQIAPKFISNSASYLSLNFWAKGLDAIGLRHNVPGHGVLYYSVFVLFLIGLTAGVVKHRRRHLFLIWWFLAGLIPSIITNDAPHAVRSLLALPPVIFLSAIGVSELVKSSVRLFKSPKPAVIILSLIIAIECISYLSTYYSSYAVSSASSFQYGYKEAILTAESVGQANDKFIVTTKYGQPYLYTLLVRKIDPEEFKFGALANYEFHEITWPEGQANRVYVATPEEIDPQDPAVVKVITIPNTQIPIFVIAKT